MQAISTIQARDWLSLAEALAALEVSPRTLDAMVGRDEIRSTIEPRHGRKPQRMYHGGDVERIAEERRHGKHKPQSGQNGNAKSAGSLALALPDGFASLAERFVALQELAAQANADTAKANAAAAERAVLDRQLWLSLDEAAAYSGIAHGCLRELIAERKIEALRIGAHHSWRIRRASLEAFEG